MEVGVEHLRHQRTIFFFKAWQFPAQEHDRRGLTKGIACLASQGSSDGQQHEGHQGGAQGASRWNQQTIVGPLHRRPSAPREGASEAAPAAVRQAFGGGCQSGWGRLLSVTNAIEAGQARHALLEGAQRQWAPRTPSGPHGTSPMTPGRGPFVGATHATPGARS